MTKEQLFQLTHALNSMENFLGTTERQLDERGIAIPSALINVSGYLKTAQMIANDALHIARYPEEPGGKLA